MLGFEISILDSCGCFSFILVNSLMIAILTETCCWLSDKQNKIVGWTGHIVFMVTLPGLPGFLTSLCLLSLGTL
jgi:uncharacterized membrane protein